MTDGPCSPFRDAVCYGNLESVSRGGSGGHGIAQMTTEHEQEGFLGPIGGAVG